MKVSREGTYRESMTITDIPTMKMDCNLPLGCSLPYISDDIMRRRGVYISEMHYSGNMFKITVEGKDRTKLKQALDEFYDKAVEAVDFYKKFRRMYNGEKETSEHQLGEDSGTGGSGGEAHQGARQG